MHTCCKLPNQISKFDRWQLNDENKVTCIKIHIGPLEFLFISRTFKERIWWHKATKRKKLRTKCYVNTTLFLNELNATRRRESDKGFEGETVKRLTLRYRIQQYRPSRALTNFNQSQRLGNCRKLTSGTPNVEQQERRRSRLVVACKSRERISTGIPTLVSEERGFFHKYRSDRDKDKESRDYPFEFFSFNNLNFPPLSTC